MITEEQYQQALQQKDQAQETINAYHIQKAEQFKARLESGEPFTDDDLFYSATALCPCGHGLAYPKGCGGFHYWDCSAVLKGIESHEVAHTEKLPFAYYKVKGESEYNGTTRGVFRPQIMCRHRIPGCTGGDTCTSDHK